MMETLSTGLTWAEIKEKFDADSEFNLLLDQRNRRTNLSKRKENIKDERKVWRLIVQKNCGKFVRTIYRANLRDGDDDLLNEKASDKIVAQLNNLLTK